MFSCLPSHATPTSISSFLRMIELHCKNCPELGILESFHSSPVYYEINKSYLCHLFFFLSVLCAATLILHSENRRNNQTKVSKQNKQKVNYQSFSVTLKNQGIAKFDWYNRILIEWVFLLY